MRVVDTALESLSASRISSHAIQKHLHGARPMVYMRRIRLGGSRWDMTEAKGNRCGALPSKHNHSRDGHQMQEGFMLDPFIDISRTIEEDMNNIERRMERAMERMQSSGLDQDGYGRKYTREFRDENAHSKTYFSESVTIMRPGSSIRRGSQPGMGHIGLIAAGIAAVSWYQGTKRFLNMYQYSTFSDDYKWKLALVWPFLFFTSPKFRHEWENAVARKREALGKKPRSIDPASVDDC